MLFLRNTARLAGRRFYSAQGGRVPKLTLYTGGRECSLCEDAKEVLHAVQAETPFHLELYNIRDPPAAPERPDEEVHRWRRAYQYDIPVLHLEGEEIMRHRIGAEELRRRLRAWREKAGRQ